MFQESGGVLIETSLTIPDVRVSEFIRPFKAEAVPEQISELLGAVSMRSEDHVLTQSRPRELSASIDMGMKGSTYQTR